MSVTRSSSATIGLALAGGGPAGSVYEIGALRALDECFDGVDFSRLPVYVGVSGGAFVASCLANGIGTDQLCRAVVRNDPGEHPFVPEAFFTPALGHIAKGAFKVPRLLVESLWDYVANPDDVGLLRALGRLSQALPVGIFDNRPIRLFLENLFRRPGRTSDFRQLRTKLFLVATDLDSGRPVRFGEPGLDHVPIPVAVQASTALPGLYPPVEIEGRHYVDGVLLKTVHASVALDAGAGLVVAVNPIVPVDTLRSVELGVMRRGKLAERGLPAVLSQTFRTVIHSRMGVGLAAYERRYSDRDVLVFEPRRDDYHMFFANVFSFAARKTMCEHAYRSTRARLWRNRHRLQPVLAGHGIGLRTDLLEDEDRDLWESVGLDPPTPPTAGPEVAERLSLLLERVERVVDAG